MGKIPLLLCHFILNENVPQILLSGPILFLLTEVGISVRVVYSLPS